MKPLLEALGTYRSLNPAGWVSVYQHLPMMAGLVLVAVGLFLLLFGGGRLFRVVAGPVGAIIGLLWTPVVMMKLGLGEPQPVLTYAVALVLAIAGIALPASTTFLAFGIPIGLAAGQLAGASDFLLGFGPGFLVGGLAAALMHRSVAAVASSVVGGWLLVIGLLSSLAQLGTVVTQVAHQPWGVVLAAVLFAIAGSIYQIAVRPSPEEAARLKAERHLLKKRADEKKALERRWGGLK